MGCNSQQHIHLAKAQLHQCLHLEGHSWCAPKTSQRNNQFCVLCCVVCLLGIVITDYDEKFSNKYYHSAFDTLRNSGMDRDTICMASTLFARTLYRIAATEVYYNESFASNRINSDCNNLIEYLLECLVNNVACGAIVNRFMVPVMAGYSGGSGNNKMNTHYTGVYQIRENDMIDGTPKFVYQFLANATRRDIIDSVTCKASFPDCLPNGGICGGDSKEDNGFHCIHSSTYYHSAVDTSLEFNYKTSTWTVLNRSHSMIWTESNWPKLGARFFQRESPTATFVALASGIGMLLFSCCFTWRATVYCNNKFKTL